MKKFKIIFMLMSTIFTSSISAHAGLTIISSGMYNGSPSNAAKNYKQIQTGSFTAWNAVENQTKQVAAVAGTAYSLYVSVTGAPGAGTSYDYTIRQNGASSGVTCNISGAATTCKDTTHSFSFVAGDLLDFEASPNSTPTAPTQVTWGFVINNGTGKSILFAGSDIDQIQNDTTYFAIQGDYGANHSAERAETLFPTAGKIKNLYVRSNLTPPSGQTFIVTLFQNVGGTSAPTSTALTCTLTNAGGATCNDTTDSVTVSAGDVLTYQGITSATSGSIKLTGIGVEFDPTNDGESVGLSNAQAKTLAQASTGYSLVGGAAEQGAVSATEAPVQTIIPIPCLVSHLYIGQYNNGAGTIAGLPSGQTLTTDVRANAATPASPVEVVITGTAGNGNDTTHTEYFNAGDLISFKFVTSATTGTVNTFTYCVLYKPVQSNYFFALQ